MSPRSRRETQRGSPGIEAAWVVQYVVVGGLLIYLWWYRAPGWLIVLAPIVVLVLELLLDAVWPQIGFFDSEGDASDSSTFADAFVPLVCGVVLATAAVGYVAERAMALSRRNRT